MSFYKELFIALSLFLLVFLIGVFGFYWVAPEANWLDALYMTVITISTVGFGEVVQLDARGKLFTVGFIIVSISVIAYSAKILLSYFIEGTLTQQFQRQRMMKTIAKMNNHAIICGCGRTGKEALSQLMDMNFPVVIIEKDPAIFEQLPKKVVKILGDAQQEAELQNAGIGRARYLITALPGDAENLYVVLTARQLAPQLNIVSRASEEHSIEKLRFAGANHVVLPDALGGNHMVRLLFHPDVIRFLEALTTSYGDAASSIAEIEIDHLTPAQQGKTLSELGLRQETGCNVIGYIQPNSPPVINPSAHQKIALGAILIVLGTQEAHEKLRRMFSA